MRLRLHSCTFCIPIFRVIAVAVATRRQTQNAAPAKGAQHTTTYNNKNRKPLICGAVWRRVRVPVPNTQKF